MGCVCTTRLIAESTAMKAKRQKRITSRLMLRATNETGDQQVEQRHREQKRPGEFHQLIVAEARQRSANPDEDEDQEARFGQNQNSGMRIGFSTGTRNRPARSRKTTPLREGDAVPARAGCVP